MRERELKPTGARLQRTKVKSLPMRERELKLRAVCAIVQGLPVAPHAGARIETYLSLHTGPGARSLPMRERELKQSAK